jgi:hypothetical protein
VTDFGGEAVKRDGSHDRSGLRVVVEREAPMAKRTRGLKSTSAPDPSSVEARYPNIAAWVQDGWIEVGRDDYSTSFVRALDIGGLVFEGKSHCASLDEAFRDLDAGIAKMTN